MKAYTNKDELKAEIPKSLDALYPTRRLTRVIQWVMLKFAAMNLKNLDNWVWKGLQAGTFCNSGDEVACCAA